MIIFFLIKICRAAIDFSSTTYPFPSDDLTLSYENIDAPQNDCVLDMLGDGKCDISNNNEICGYDNGDCCRYTCEINCAGGCKHECESRGYNCIENTQCSTAYMDLAKRCPNVFQQNLQY